MTTLNELRKQVGYKTIKAFTEAAQQAGVRTYYGGDFSPSTASQWLHGEYYKDMYDTYPNIHPSDHRKLLTLLHVNEEEYGEVAQESRDERRRKWSEKHPITPEMRAAHEASIKKAADEAWSKMTDAGKERVHQEAIRLGIARPERRSPIEIMIDRACGIE